MDDVWWVDGWMDDGWMDVGGMGVGWVDIWVLTRSVDLSVQSTG